MLPMLILFDMLFAINIVTEDVISGKTTTLIMCVNISTIINKDDEMSEDDVIPPLSPNKDNITGIND